MDFISWLIAPAIIAVPFWVGMKKSGMNPALSLVVFIPAIGFFIALYLFAYSKWPAVNVENIDG